MCSVKMARPIRASAPAKIILFGEHSVVYGAPAIAASIDRRTTVTITDNSENAVTFRFEKFGIEASFPLPLTNATAPQGLELQQRQAMECGLLICQNLTTPIIEGIKITVTSDFPLGSGLGSSASFSVALSAALVANESVQNGVIMDTAPNGLIKISDANMSQIKELAGQCEKIFHGNPSGIDTATCSMGGIIRFQRDVGIEQIGESLPMKVAIVDSKVTRQTSAIVQRVKDLKHRLPEAVGDVIKAMRSVAEAATEEIRNPSSCQNILDLVRLNHGLLYSLGVSHPVLENISISVADLGVGFKLTGAGAGGNALVFIPPDVAPEKVSLSLIKNGFEGNIVTVGVPGVQVTISNKEI